MQLFRLRHRPKTQAQHPGPGPARARRPAAARSEPMAGTSSGYSEPSQRGPASSSNRARPCSIRRSIWPRSSASSTNRRHEPGPMMTRSARSSARSSHRPSLNVRSSSRISGILGRHRGRCRPASPTSLGAKTRTGQADTTATPRHPAPRRASRPRESPFLWRQTQGSRTVRGWYARHRHRYGPCWSPVHARHRAPPRPNCMYWTTCVSLIMTTGT